MKLTMLITFLFSTIFVLFTLKPILAQDDPFHVDETGPVSVKSQDIFLLWMQNYSGTIHSYQKVYRYKTDGILIPTDSLDIDTMLTKTDRRDDSRPGKATYVDVANGRFNVDPYDDPVSIWRNPNSSQKIEIMISHFDTTGFFTNTTATTLDAGEDIRQDEEIYVRTGNFDSDSTDEFIVAYRDASDSVIFCVYDVDSTLQTTLVKRFSNSKVAGSGLTHFVKYYIETADLNGDGVDELISFTWESSVLNSSVPIMVRIYAFENGAIVPKATSTIQVGKTGSLQDFIMAAAKGQFDYDESDELVFGAVEKSDDPHTVRLRTIEVSSNLSQITLGTEQSYTIETSHSTNTYTEFGLATGDLNNTYNKRDEIVFAAGNRIRVLEVTNLNTFNTKALLNIANGGSTDWTQSGNYLKVSDMNMDNKEDIIIVKHITGTTNTGFETAVWSFTDSTLNNSTLYARLLGDENNPGSLPYAISVGNYDGFDFKIGQPSHHSFYNISQPIVILNAPPIHFDKLGNDIFDVSGCYNGGNCDFYSKHIWTQTQISQSSTEVHADWQISAGAKVEGEITAAPMGVGTALEYKIWAIRNFGLHFELAQTFKQTIQIQETVTSKFDDQIFSTVVNYDVWEYPVYHGNETFPRRSYFAVVPNSVDKNWYESKSYHALNYVPDHEVDNILSYYPYDTLTNNPNLSEAIVASYSGNSYTLGANPGPNWDLKISNFYQNNASLKFNMGLDFGVEFAGASFNFKSSYELMTTHQTSIDTTIDLLVQLGSLNMGIGDVKYTVTPYAYWAKNGALVVDYAVQPELAPPGYPNTWWQDKYGTNSDPAFILPWRLDPEKGFTLTDETKRFQTNDIYFYPNKPAAGDTLTIKAHLRNFSIVPTPIPITVKFYLGDPDSGGTAIIGVNGSNTVSTNSYIPDRGTSVVEFKWVVPPGLPQYPRIYAVLDRDNAIAEIHEDNNKGFNVLGVSSVSDVENENNIIPEEYMLYQSYPNPFNPSTTIKYSIPNSDRVNLKVYDILGREVATLVNEYKTPGTYAVEFNASRFASGVYFYQIQSGNFIETKKMILLK